MISQSKGIIIFIMGTSAVGKTKLSLSLADHLKNCEIINCDSMQMYKQADIMTAKATKEEQSKIKHHLFDILDLSMKDFNRNNYVEIAIKLIDKLHAGGTIPIVVGGTHYYIESLLFKDNEMFQEETKTEEKPFEEITGVDDYNLLKQIDPVMAGKIHSNDKRKIRNYLNLYNKHKKLPSEMLKSCEFEKTLRYENSIILWPYMQNIEVLREKARIRIEEMANHEGIKEIIYIYESFCSEVKEIEDLEKNLDFQRGVLQAIGYKEFFLFYKEIKKLLLKLNLSFEKLMTNEKEMEDLLLYIEGDKNLQKIFVECKNRLLMRTMKYTKKQLVWIENRLINLKILENRIFKFEFGSYNGNEFNEKVLNPARNILSAFKNHLDCNALKENFADYLVKLNNKPQGKRVALEEWKKFYCSVCDCELNGPKEWEIHLRSRKHNKDKKRVHLEEKIDKNGEEKNEKAEILK